MKPRGKKVYQRLTEDLKVPGSIPGRGICFNTWQCSFKINDSRQIAEKSKRENTIQISNKKCTIGSYKLDPYKATFKG